ncbi:MAG TPA: hypothetical protein VK190_03520 [Pseudoneobacillus sp.]|nr:hypothetical protein [Pseudoneobacillus sp.]
MELKFNVVKSEPGSIVIHISDGEQKIGKLNIIGNYAKILLDRKLLPLNNFPDTYKTIMGTHNNLLEGKLLDVIYEEGAL